MNCITPPPGADSIDATAAPPPLPRTSHRAVAVYRMRAAAGYVAHQQAGESEGSGDCAGGEQECLDLGRYCQWA